jgi:hypothetical protein
MKRFPIAPLPTKTLRLAFPTPPTLSNRENLFVRCAYEFSFRAAPIQLSWSGSHDCIVARVDNGRLEEKTRKFYRNGWRLLKATPVAEMRTDQITGVCAEQRHKGRRLGVSVQACCFGSPVLHRSPVSGGAPESGLPKELVLYCARRDYGTRVLMRTGNLAAVMRTMGHRDVKTAMHYQHP